MLAPAIAMHSPLDTLVSEGILDDVLGRLKSGKEADVFRVLYRGEVVVAKVYKDRDQRSFKNNAVYKEGRTVRNSRTQRAMEKGSRFGRGEDEDEWKASEARCLHRLHAAGVRVPTPVMFYEGVLLMELVSDAEGNAAPRLIDASFDPPQAADFDGLGEVVDALESIQSSTDDKDTEGAKLAWRTLLRAYSHGEADPSLAAFLAGENVHHPEPSTVNLLQAESTALEITDEDADLCIAIAEGHLLPVE